MEDTGNVGRADASLLTASFEVVPGKFSIRLLKGS